MPRASKRPGATPSKKATKGADRTPTKKAGAKKTAGKAPGALPSPKRARATKRQQIRKTLSPMASPKKKRSQEDRRSDMDRAERAILGKLIERGYDKEIVKAVRNKQGQSIYDVTAEEYSTMRRDEYLKQSHWERVHREFDLQNAVWSTPVVIGV